MQIYQLKDGRLFQAHEEDLTFLTKEDLLEEATELRDKLAVIEAAIPSNEMNADQPSAPEATPEVTPPAPEATPEQPAPAPETPAEPVAPVEPEVPAETPPTPVLQ